MSKTWTNPEFVVHVPPFAFNLTCGKSNGLKTEQNAAPLLVQMRAVHWAGKDKLELMLPTLIDWHRKITTLFRLCVK